MSLHKIPANYLSQISPVKIENRSQSDTETSIKQTSGANRQDRIDLSADALAQYKSFADSPESNETASKNKINHPKDATQSLDAERSDEDRSAVDELKARDREVHVHEQAHLSAAGGYATSGARFTFETGPDGKRYAVGGEVSIDTSAVPDDPEATIRKMQVVRKAALAPMNPSAADRAIAAKAGAVAAEARAELLQQNDEGGRSNLDKNELKNSIGTSDEPLNAYRFRNGISAYENAAYAT